jgi:hypothetical protein
MPGAGWRTWRGTDVAGVCREPVPEVNGLDVLELEVAPEGFVAPNPRPLTQTLAEPAIAWPRAIVARAAVGEVRALGGTELYTSRLSGRGGPESFSLHPGFLPAGEVDAGESPARQARQPAGAQPP